MAPDGIELGAELRIKAAKARYNGRCSQVPIDTTQDVGSGE